MKVLAIGNSFSQDATRYLHQIARADGYDLDVTNLYIGGCPLAYHYGNTLSNEKTYSLEFNGVTTGFSVSIRDALESGGFDKYDVVTVQQVSHLSFRPETFHPYIERLAEFIRKYIPSAKLMVHETWAYLKDSETLKKYGFDTPETMFDAVDRSYRQAVKDISADGMIPSGAAFREMMNEGIYDLHRDDIHASLGFGRYILGLVWYETLTGRSCIGNTFRDFDEEISEQRVLLAQKVVHALVGKELI